MDGATGLSKQQSFHQESDAYWLVLLYQDYFENHETGQQPLQDYIKDAITSVTRQATKIRPLNPIPAYSLPTAGLFFCDFKESQFRYLQLGDCKCLISSPKKTTLLGESKLEELDAEVLARVVQHQEQGVGDHQDMWNQLLPLLKQNRSKANRDGGYWILGFDSRAAQHAIQGQIEVSAEDRLLLMTDGYTRLFDVFKGTTPGGLLEHSFDLGLARMIERLRTLETGDPECRMYPRIKCHDDASALLIDIVAAASQ
jgi:hypothetical protein